MKLDLVCNNQNIEGERPLSDEFYTPNYAITPLLKYLKPKSKIWCPFDTEDSNFVKLLKKEGHTVVYTHIDNNKDFFKLNPKKEDIDYIISNPPYSLKFEIFEKLFQLSIPFAMLVGVVGIFESQKRFNLFKDNKFEVMYFNKRISYFKDFSDQKPSLNPPFSSVYISSGILPNSIVFENIDKNEK